MNESIKKVIKNSVLNLINNTISEKKLKKLKNTHKDKIHFIPIRYRIFGGLLQSLNIQFGNFIEKLITNLIENDGRYRILSEYSGKKSNRFNISEDTEKEIDAYISNQQINSNTDKDIVNNFISLQNKIIINEKQENTKTITFKHDVDVLFKDNETGIVYYLEIKYNDDHDTGKFVDINRKFIKTYSYLVRKLKIYDRNKFIPILFFFTNKRMKGNIYIPEQLNILRGKEFFNKFLRLKYSDLDNYMKELGNNDEIIKLFDDLYSKIRYSEF